jgi:hypothetical protein
MKCYSKQSNNGGRNGTDKKGQTGFHNDDLGKKFIK